MVVGRYVTKQKHAGVDYMSTKSAGQTIRACSKVGTDLAHALSIVELCFRVRCASVV